MGFAFGLLVLFPAGIYLGYKFNATIQDWLDMRE